MEKKVVANLLIFEKEWKSGLTQAELIEHAKILGFDIVEIRREYFRAIEKEIPEIRKVIDKNFIELYYSVPDRMFINGTLNPMLQTYLDEARQMGIKKIKWNIGDFELFKGDLKEILSPLLEHSIEVNVENDQSPENGTIAPIYKFMTATKDNQIDIGFVFDVGNWIFVQEDLMQAAVFLGEFVRYIHLKDVLNTKDGLKVLALDLGNLPWKQVLSKLSKNCPVALEYPAKSDSDIMKDVEKIKSME